MRKANFLMEDEAAAEQQAEIGTTVNTEAPRMVALAPERFTKAIYVQRKYARAFDAVVAKQKQIGGLKGSELAEEAIAMLCQKYDVTI